MQSVTIIEAANPEQPRQQMVIILQGQQHQGVMTIIVREDGREKG
jgi:hypothetical protein